MGILSATMYLKTSRFEFQNFSDCSVCKKGYSTKMYQCIIDFLAKFFCSQSKQFKLDLLIIYFVAIFISCPIVEH